MAYTAVSKAVAERHEGSTPFTPTKYKKEGKTMDALRIEKIKQRFNSVKEILINMSKGKTDIVKDFEHFISLAEKDLVHPMKLDEFEQQLEVVYATKFMFGAMEGKSYKKQLAEEEEKFNSQ